jgi:hypothetical protein
VEIPPAAQRISLTGKTVMPGMVDPYYVFGRRPTQSALDNIPARFRRFRRPGTQAFQAGPFIKVTEYFYPWDTEFRPAVRSGITTAQLVTDGRGLSALAALSPNPSGDMLLDVEGILFAKITNQTSAINVLRDGLDPEASRPSRGFAGRRGRRVGGGPPAAENGDDRGQASQNESARQQEIKSLWQAVRDGKRPLIVNVNNAATVSHLLKLLAEYEKVNCCLVATGPNLYLSLDEIRDRQVKVILQPGIDEVPFTTERMNVARMIEETGIPFALSLSMNESQFKAGQDDPLFPVAMLVKTGLSRMAAIEALTIAPARMLGIESLCGSLEDGKSADFLVFDGDPLATGTRLEKIISQGKTIHEN